MLPDQPSTFRQPSPAERPWWWRLEDGTGTEIELPPGHAEYVDQRFPTQGDAESWIGEAFRPLVAAGVTAVTLMELDREVYGPMSLNA